MTNEQKANEAFIRLTTKWDRTSKIVDEKGNILIPYIEDLAIITDQYLLYHNKEPIDIDFLKVVRFYESYSGKVLTRYLNGFHYIEYDPITKVFTLCTQIGDKIDLPPYETKGQILQLIKVLNYLT